MSRKRWTMVSLLAVVVLFCGSYALTSANQVPAAPDTTVELELPELEPAGEEACAGELSADLASLDPTDASAAAACGCKDLCRRDRDCDRICGAKGAGVCIQGNSCCNECACLY